MCLALMVGYPIIRSTHFRKFGRIFKWCVVHDETNEKYYAIYSDEDWKFWDLYKKVEIPTDVAKEKIASENKLEKIVD